MNKYKTHLDKIFNYFGIDETKNIVIFGAGKRGYQTLELLENMHIEVLGFCDNNKAKQGNKIYEKYCYAPTELGSIDNLTLIVSPDNSKQLYHELSEKYDRVLRREELELFLNFPYLSGYKEFFPIGHFYSLYPNLNTICEKQNDIYDMDKTICDINLNEDVQLNFLTQMGELYSTIPDWKDIADTKNSTYRYRYHNPSFSVADSIGLHCMLRILRPKKMIEVGSGWSSAVSLDTNEFYMNNSIEMSFIEPYPALLKSILKSTDNISLLSTGLQETDVRKFQELKSGDLLFIDSTHVSKVGSDVNYLFFEILPHLQHGVYIHLHDIFYPFEYPIEWTKKGMVWNELYLLRAFLQNNKDYEILYFQNFIEKKYGELVKEIWPFEQVFHGGSIWIRKK